MKKKLLRHGIHERQELPPEDDPNYCALKVYQASTLAILSKEYKLFSHGLLFTHGGWDRDPLSDYLAEWNPEFAPFVIDLPSRVFSGMTCKDERGHRRAEWCYKLLAIRHEGWEGLFAFMSLVGAVQRDSGYLAKLLAQVVLVPDVLKLERKAFSLDVCPQTEVVVFGIDSNKRAVYIEPAKNPPLDKPRVRMVAPDPETIDLAAKVLQGDPDPYKAIDLKLTEIKRAEAEKIFAASQFTKVFV